MCAGVSLHTPNFMIPVILAAQEGGLMDLAKSTGEQFGFNTSLFISQVISFLIVAFLLKKFAYNPIVTVLEQRRKQIADSLTNVEKIKKELAETEAARQQILAQANTQANKLIEE